MNLQDHSRNDKEQPPCEEENEKTNEDHEYDTFGTGQYADLSEEDHEYSMDEEDLGVDERAENYDFKPHSSSSDEDTEVEDEEPTNVHKRKKKYVRTKLQKFFEFRPEVDMANPIFKPGLSFASGAHFKKAVREYAIQQGKDVYFEKNDSNTCPRTNKNRFASSKWLAEKDLDRFKMHDKWVVSAFQQSVGREKILVISRDKAYKAWMFATKEIEGTYQEQYNALWDYAEEIKHTNKDSTIKILTEATEDGQLLTTVAIVPNNQMYPVAFAVVEIENKDSWSWFVNLLKGDLKIENSLHWSFITDKQKGLEQALKGMWEDGIPEAEHRHCARHLEKNFIKVFRDKTLKKP
ncbi:uncharacterized protein LOC115696575 [Cannabis sativa]|uniref:uncharacterized protein LOC115696575 n=1 Tax=Cannabis sativa TaxID=3483 RepID=UPI0011DF564C|nr:uncharacterized protein LOC115696575 [Cannabis sativa]